MDAAYDKYFSSSSSGGGSGKTGIEDGRTETPSRQKRQRSPQRARRNLVQELEESAAELNNNSSVQDQRHALDNALAAGRLLLKRKAEKRIEALRRLQEQSIEDVDQHAAEVINELIINKDNPEKVASIIEEEEPVSAVLDRVAKAVASDQPIEPREIEKLEQAAQEKAIPEERQAAAQALRTIRAEAPVQPPPNEEEVMLRAFHRELTAIMKRALAPLVTFASMVGVKMNQQDFRMMLSYQQDQPSLEVRLERVVEWAPTMDAYIAANAPYLGRTFLTAFARHFGRLYALQGPSIIVQNRIPFGLGDVRDIQRTAASGYNLDTLRETYNNSRELAQQDPQNEQFRRDAENALRAYTAARLLNQVSQAGNELFVDFSPAWCWELLSVTIFQKLLSMSSLAAIEAAHSVVQRIPGCDSFGIKELILSTDVNDQFAFLVASHFLTSSEGVATTRGRVKKNGVYMNIMHMRSALASQIHACQVWFEIHVRKVPSTLPRKFDEERARLFPGGVGEPADGDFDNFRNQLPRWELAFFK